MRARKVIRDYSWVRWRLAKALGRDELPDDVWDLLEKRGSISKYTQQQQRQPLGEPPIRELVEEARDFLKLSGDHESASRKPVKMLREDELTSGKMSPNRAVAITLLLAQEAAKDERVQQFRQDCLGGKLLPLEQMTDWIISQKKRTGLKPGGSRCPLRTPRNSKPRDYSSPEADHSKSALRGQDFSARSGICSMDHLTVAGRAAAFP